MKKNFIYLFLIETIILSIIFVDYLQYSSDVNNHLYHFTSNFNKIGSFCLSILELTLKDNIFSIFLIIGVIALAFFAIVEKMQLDPQKNILCFILKLVEYISFMVMEMGIFVYFVIFPVLMIVCFIIFKLPVINLEALKIILLFNVLLGIEQFIFNNPLNKQIHQLFELIR